MSFVRYSLFLLLSGCYAMQSGGVITNTTPTKASKYIPCEVLEPIFYSGKNDSAATIEKVRKYNAVYDSLCL